MKKVILLLISIFLLLACGKQENKEKKKEILNFAQSAEIRSLDPHLPTDVYSRRIIYNIFNRLVEKNENLEIIPSLAENWEQISDTETIFNLRNDVLFQNGEPLTSIDVKYSLEKAMNSPTSRILFELIEEIKTPNNQSLIIKTKKPFGALLDHLSHVTASIMNKKYNEKNANYGLKPMGTGPYKVTEWITGDKVILNAFNDYYQGSPSIKTIYVRGVPEENSRVIGLQTGEIDIAMDITTIARTSVLSESFLKLYETSGMGVSYLGFNTGKAPLNNHRLREAIALGINRDIIIESIMMNSVEKANSILGPSVTGYSKNAKTLEYNQNKAKEILKEINYDYSTTIKYIIPSSELSNQSATVIQAQLKEIGINIEIEQLEWSAFLSASGRGETDLFSMSWSNSSGDADYSLFGILHSSMAGTQGNRSFFKNDQFDHLLEKGKVELNKEKRMSFYEEAQNIINKEIPLFPLNFSLANAGVNIKNIEGYIQSPLNNPNFFKLKFK